MNWSWKNGILVIFMLFGSLIQANAQNIDFSKESTLGNLFIRMYGEVHYYQPVGGSTFEAGQFDAKRIVALFGYQFNRNTQFVTEWELEHANEIFLEQAFIKHKLKGKTSLKAGMLLIPMGIINENHEPNNFFSVDRPLLDRNLVPSTWRDIGAGITGLLPGDFKYQLYLVNGLLGYQNGAAKFGASSAYRSGRQKGIKTIFSSLPAVSGQLEYFGFKNGKVGLSLYAGESNTDAYQGVERSNKELKAGADSTTVFTSMAGLHANFDLNNFVLRGQLIFAHNGGIEAYQEKTGSSLGKSSLGMYVELGRPFTKNEKWIAFGRYSFMDNVLETKGNNNINHTITAGFNYMAAKGAVLKLDGQLTDLDNNASFTINAGIGVWF